MRTRTTPRARGEIVPATRSLPPASIRDDARTSRALPRAARSVTLSGATVAVPANASVKMPVGLERKRRASALRRRIVPPAMAASKLVVAPAER
jgi:hypothetical protein